MTSFAKYLFAALAILAMGFSQMLGITRGYVCHCPGALEMANGPDCESAGCHDHDDDGGHDDSGGDHQHDRLGDSLVSLSFSPLAVSLPVLVETDVLLEFHRRVRLYVELAKQHVSLKPPDDSGVGPPAGVLVARTMVMLV